MTIFRWLNKIVRLAAAVPPRNDSVSGKTSLQEPADIQTTDIHNRLHWLQDKLVHCTDIVYHHFVAGPQLACALVYLRGMIDLNSLQQDVLKPLQTLQSADSSEQFLLHIFDYKQLPIANQTEHISMQDALRGVLEGEVLLIINGEPRILALSLVKLENRAITEAVNEIVIRGPREAFNENLETNITLIRKRLRTPDFKLHTMHIGHKTHTTVVIGYIEGVCKQELLDEVKLRLSRIDINAVLDSGYLEEFIEDNPYSPFPQLQYTERPDTASAALIEGRVLIMVDGTPITLIAPVTLFMLVQSAEDYYQRYISASWIRLVRFLFLNISVLLPSIYIAITTFHPDIIPERLLMTLASSREVVPFPALVEAFMMELSFEALREATIRIPKAVGQSVSIIGALIIGTAAVEAGIVSAAMVIIVSLTGIASFIIPHFDLGLAFRLLRFPIMLLAGAFGLFGIVCGMLIIYIHLLDLRSFGVPYLSPIAPYQSGASQDSLLRAPWWAMKRKPAFSSTQNKNSKSSTARHWEQSSHEEE